MWVRRHLWWIIGGLCLLLCIGLILASYRFDWSGTGFSKKTVWDWLQLLIVPLVLAVVALLFQLANTRTERQIARQRYEQDQQIALDKQREDLLQAYLDRMSELLIEKSLSTSPTEEVRNVARARTITVLTQLDARRVSYVFAFLREAGLMSKQSKSNIVSLEGADFHGVQWRKADLSHANLCNTNLNYANLCGTDLRFSIFTNARAC